MEKQRENPTSYDPMYFALGWVGARIPLSWPPGGATRPSPCYDNKKVGEFRILKSLSVCKTEHPFPAEMR